MEVGLIPRHHSTHTLLGTFKWLRADPKNRRVRVKGLWPDREYDLDGFRRWFRGQLDRKVSGETRPRGRKDDANWQRAAGHIARAVNTPRLIVRETECPFEFRGRLRHRFYAA